MLLQAKYLVIWGVLLGMPKLEKRNYSRKQGSMKFFESNFICVMPEKQNLLTVTRIQ